jgi:iron complex outermembrane receptor protein
MAAAAHAQTAGPAPEPAPQEAGPQAAPPAPGETVVISGRRLSEADEAVGTDQASNVVAVTRDALLSAPAGVSGLKMLEGLPGFNVQTEGALGLYEFGNSVTVRAFNLQQIAFVLDGIPMGRSDAFGGSPIFRYVDNENLGSVVASPGAGDVSQPAYSSLGPIVEYHSIDPDDEMGATLSQTWGDDNLERSFVKVNTGKWGPVSAYASRTKLNSDVSRGAGTIDREHAEAKVKVDLWGEAFIDFKWVMNDFYDFDSPSLTKAQWNTSAPCANGKARAECGYSDTLPPGTLGNVLVYNVPGYTYDTTGWILDRINVRTDNLYGSSFYSPIGENAAVNVTAYWEDKDGWGSSPETYGSTTSATSLYGRYLRQSQAGLAVTAPRGTAFGISEVGGIRKGAVAKGEYELANHKLEAGFWVENDDYVRTTHRYNHEGGIQSGRILFNERVYNQRAYESTRETLQLFVKDTMSFLDDRLKVEAGIKSLKVDYKIDGYRTFNDYYRMVCADGTLNCPAAQQTRAVPGWGPQLLTETYEDNFLPMVGAVYSITPREQVFASYSQNYALPRGTDDIFSVSPNTVATVPNPGAEESENYEIGARTTRGHLYGSVAAYYTTFENRIESYAVPLQGQTGATETFFQNVGGVEAYGVELTGAWKPEIFNEQLYFNGNLTWNKTTFQDNIPNFPVGSITALQPGRTAASYLSNGALRTSGNTLVDSPEWVVSAGATWEPTTWVVANISAKYQSDRYSNFINTEEIGDFTSVSAYVDFGTGDGEGPLGMLKARVNVENLFDEERLSFISGSIGGTASFRPLNPRTVSFTLSADF